MMPDSPLLPLVDEKARKPWKYYGYQAYSEFIASEDDFFILRRFSTVSARVLLMSLSCWKKSCKERTRSLLPKIIETFIMVRSGEQMQIVIDGLSYCVRSTKSCECSMSCSFNIRSCDVSHPCIPEISQASRAGTPIGETMERFMSLKLGISTTRRT